MATLTKHKQANYHSRPLYLTVFLLTLLATCSLFLRAPQRKSALLGQESLLRARADDESCEDVQHAADQCAFVRANCADDEPGLVSYLAFYYCALRNAKPIAFAFLACWLGLLFSTIGIAASDFFSVNLSTIASVLGLPESLAGVTFLAFGNGSPDVFSTFAAMNSNSGSMAIGELIGAAGFITAVVAGSMALVREFRVSRKTFVRDIVFFICAVSFTVLFLYDGEIHLWECCAMIAFYAFYVLFVVGWHWFSTRRRRRRSNENASRSNFSAAPGHFGDEIEPYHDDADDDDEGDGAVGSHRGSGAVPDIRALESDSRTDADRSGGLQGEGDEEDEARKMHIASEMTSSMRVNRPHGRRNTTITPIRPSLIGALEFRSVLSSLQRARNMRLTPMNRARSNYNPRIALARASTDLQQLEPYRDIPEAAAESSYRDRALSSGDIPRNLENQNIQAPPLIKTASPGNEPGVPISPRDGQPRARSPLMTTSPAGFSGSTSVAKGAIHRGERAPSPAVSLTKDGHLAPPQPQRRPTSLSRETAPETEGTSASTPALSLQIPSPQEQTSRESSPAASPFPMLSESPLIITPQSPVQAAPMLPPPMVEERSPMVEERPHLPDFDVDESPKPVKWWPYSVLPPPHVLVRTLFPTLRGWEDKAIWDKIFGVISTPSVFLLVITLPVVETESPNDDDDSDGVSAAPSPGSMGNIASPVTLENVDSVEPEMEWQEYRRSTSGWNRWLLVLQLFTGPLFAMFVVWAKYMDAPVKTLVKMILYSLVVSLVLLALLLATTSPLKKPKYHFLFCFLGFIISIAWISTIAEEVVGVLKAIGVILGMSEAILGLTVFAVGNSVGDLVADITVARLGYPVMALSACFGGPMLNILLGIGLGGIYMTTQKANHAHRKHPNNPIHYKSYHINVTGTLFISAITVLFTLVILLIVVPASKWMMTRKIGLGLILIWSASTVVNVIVEVTGVWKAVA